MAVAGGNGSPLVNTDMGIFVFMLFVGTGAVLAAAAPVVTSVGMIAGAVGSELGAFGVPDEDDEPPATTWRLPG
jgi:hypothetical protein